MLETPSGREPEFNAYMRAISEEIRQLREEHRATSIAQATNAKLAAIVESSDDAIISKDLNGTILTWNPAATRIFGYSAEEMIGNSVRVLIPEHMQTEEVAILERLNAGERVEHYLTQRKTRDGRLIYVSLTISPIRDAGGTVIGASKIARDMTAQRLMEEEVRAAKEAAEAANFAKDRLIAALSHELRTPLTPVMMALGDIEHSPVLPKELLEDVRMMRRNVDLEVRLIDDLLELARVAQGKMQIRPEPLDVHDILRETIDLCAGEVGAKRLRVAVSLEAGRSMVMGDRARLGDVFWNLMRNALKFTPAGGQVSIVSRNFPQGTAEPHSLVVEVAEMGPGFAAGASELIFTPFRLGMAGEPGSSGGLGIRLAVARNIVDLHGGTIRAISEGPGKGATFQVMLRLTDASPRRVIESNRNSTSGRTFRILLVEDHPDTAKMLSRLLRFMGHEVTAVGDCLGACAAAEQSAFDLVISDIGLPDGSGIDLLPQLRKRLPELRAIAVSGFGMEEDIQRSQNAGFEAHLVKPVNFDDLLKLIQKFDLAA